MFEIIIKVLQLYWKSHTNRTFIREPSDLCLLLSIIVMYNMNFSTLYNSMNMEALKNRTIIQVPY